MLKLAVRNIASKIKIITIYITMLGLDLQIVIKTVKVCKFHFLIFELHEKCYIYQIAMVVDKD